FGDVHRPLLRPLASDYEPVSTAREIGAVERERFRDAAARADKELDQRPVALLGQGRRREGGEHPRELVRVDRFGQALLELRERDAVREVTLVEALPRQPA